MRNYFLIAPLLFSVSCSHHLPDFTTRLSTRTPTNDSSEAIGEYALGCLKGAQTFKGNEKGLLLSQMKRGRYWGHPDLIALITRAGENFHKANQKLIIGDLSQSRGGPTLTGHNSHQNGLDVDIWFKMPSTQDQISLSALETENMKSISDLGEDQIKLIKYFAQDSSVERIFINPKFKKNLCADNGALKLSAQEQHKVRPWWGHNDHIHVRINCPNGNPACVSQQPVPAGDGCGAELDWWFSDEATSAGKEASWEDLKSVYLNKIKKLPKQCSFYHETF